MLEAKIEKLTETIERLISKLDAVAATTIPVVTTEAVAVVEQSLKETIEAVKAFGPSDSLPGEKIDREALKSQCLRMIRENRSLKDEIKSITASYGATTIDNVPEDKLAELKSRVEALA